MITLMQIDTNNLCLVDGIHRFLTAKMNALVIRVCIIDKNLGIIEEKDLDTTEYELEGNLLIKRAS